MPDQILSVPGDERHIREPQRYQLQAEVEGRRLDAAPRPPQAVRPLRLDALALALRVELDVAGGAHLELFLDRLTAAAYRGDQGAPRLHARDLAAECGPREVLGRGSQHAALVPRQLLSTLRVL